MLYVYFGIFGKGLSNDTTWLDWALLAAGILATIGLGFLVTRRTKVIFENQKSSK